MKKRDSRKEKAEKKNKGRAIMAEENQKQEEEVKEETTVPQEEATEAVDERDARIQELEAKVKELEETVQTMKDDALRAAADTENYKRRLRKDKEDAVKYANEQLIGDLLDPIDNFARAIDSASQSSDFEAMKQGVVMVNDHLLQILKQNWGLEMIESSVGTAYDPNLMEAYGVQEKEGIDKEEVGMECAKGWLLHGKVLRTAKVFVAKPAK